MNRYTTVAQEVQHNGFAVLDNIYTDTEISNLIQQISATPQSGPEFLSSKDLFAIRRFFKAVPGITALVFNDKLKSLISGAFGAGHFIVKSIYFDKPQASNWFVPYHQDLMIAVNGKAELPGYGPWTVKPAQTAVQPPVFILENMFTLRIHLDDTDADNGALKVIPGSHAKGIYRPETIDHDLEREALCNVGRGAVMIMKPLLLHASGRSTSDRKRRVIHIECSNQPLPEPLSWSEFEAIPL